MRDFPRSAVSRAYYAAYARVVAALVESGVTLPSRGNPSHGSLLNLVLHNLKGRGEAQAAKLCGLVFTLYKLRLMADYSAAALLNESDTRQSLGLLTSVFRELKEPAS